MARPKNPTCHSNPLVIGTTSGGLELRDVSAADTGRNPTFWA